MDPLPGSLYSSFRFQVKKITSEELPLLLTSCTQSEVFRYSLLVYMLYFSFIGLSEVSEVLLNSCLYELCLMVFFL